MTAIRLPTDVFGYGPARAARLESERALTRALPASFLLVTALLLVLAVAQRLVPAAPVLLDLPVANGHVLSPVNPEPPAVAPVLRPSAPATAAHQVPLPVPDDVAPPLAPVAGGGTHLTPGTPATGGGGAGGEAGTGAVEADPVPGVYVYADQLPARVHDPAPEYPDLARDAGVEGTVLLWALVDLDGHVKAVQVIHSVPLLDDAASTAVKGWRFTPALANGHPVRVWVAVPVRFALH